MVKRANLRLRQRILPIEVKGLRLNVDSNCRGFEIQGLQKSDVFENDYILDVVIQTVRPHKKRGPHFHNHKTEWFLPLDGAADLYGYESSEDITRLRYKFLMTADYEHPKIYVIRPKTCHWVKNNTERDFYMIAFSNTEYDNKNPDNIPCPDRSDSSTNSDVYGSCDQVS